MLELLLRGRIWIKLKARRFIFIERLWRSLNQETVFLHALTDGFVAERVSREWITFYNTDRPHTALDKRTPDEAYFDGKELKKTAW